MDNMNLPNKNAPFIKRTINGQEFTVLIHFQDGCRESAQKKSKECYVLMCKMPKFLFDS